MPRSPLCSPAVCAPRTSSPRARRRPARREWARRSSPNWNGSAPDTLCRTREELRGVQPVIDCACGRNSMGELVAWGLGLGLGYVARSSLTTRGRILIFLLTVLLLGGLITLLSGELFDEPWLALVDIGQVA